MRFKDQIVVITGAARGIGFATARRLASEGAAIAVVDVNETGSRDAAARLEGEGVRAIGYGLDVSDGDAVDRLMAKIHADFGAIHALVNAAAIFPFSAFETMDRDEWRRVIDVNLTGTFYCCQAALPYMKAQGYGRIVNFASGTIDLGSPNLAHYVASKGGVIGLTHTMASELGEHGITCNAVSPGVIATEGMNAVEAADETKAFVLMLQSIKRTGEPADIAECIAYLASPAASFITGQTITIDGGMNKH
jgi:NAD(P)-dependent dehydrogenase (short-subunit alcohol dehydrogenase family)